MNKAMDFFDKEKMSKLFYRKVIPLYPNFDKIKDMEITGYKKLIWEKSYHVVFEFMTIFIENGGDEYRMPIFCTAHNSEPRKNVFESLEFLWQAGFSEGELTIPRPLFYSEYYNGTFYRGVEGRDLYQYIREQKIDQVNAIIPKAAAWFAKLHGIPREKGRNFNEENSRIATVFPGMPHIIKRISEDYPQYAADYERIYRTVNDKEIAFFKSTDRRWLVHGDAHPENVIKMGENKTAVIDFTDLCLSDFARDLGAFTQQLDYMCGRKIEDENIVAQIKRSFLDSYFANANIKLDDDLRSRIDNYYYWTAIRTATFFLIKADKEPERAYPIIEMVKKGLGIN